MSGLEEKWKCSTPSLGSPVPLSCHPHRESLLREPWAVEWTDISPALVGSSGELQPVPSPLLAQKLLEEGDPHGSEASMGLPVLGRSSQVHTSQPQAPAPQNPTGLGDRVMTEETGLTPGWRPSKRRLGQTSGVCAHRGTDVCQPRGESSGHPTLRAP